MKFVYAFAILAGLFLQVSAAAADSVVLKNGDHLTGTITGSDGKDLTLKTDFAGDIKIHWSAIKEASSEKALYVVTADKKTVNGNVTSDGTNVIVHTASAGEIQVPLARLTVMRSADDQAAYEKSQHPGILESWKGGLNIGLALARGNSDTTNLNTGFTAVRKTPNDQISIYESSIYTTNGGVNSGVTANEILGGARYDRNITKKIFAFGAAILRMTSCRI